MKRPDKIRKMQEELICEIHPYTIQSIGKGGKRVCQHCIRDKKHQRDIVKGRVQITYTKPKEILTPMGNNIR
jgi:predicted nuclease with RNAse H fold